MTGEDWLTRERLRRGVSGSFRVLAMRRGIRGRSDNLRARTDRGGGRMPQEPLNPALQSLMPLIGEWKVEVPQFPGQYGHATFEWLNGGTHLRFHAVAPEPAPTATLIIGRDGLGEEFTILHYDSRGVSRVYRMTFGDGTWRMWRDAPGFWQRFFGRLSADGHSIRGSWEKSEDGSTWDPDLELVYTKVG
jgi:hypothetical protein